MVARSPSVPSLMLHSKVRNQNKGKQKLSLSDQVG